MADSKAVTKDNLRTADTNDFDIISRLPRTFTLADDLVEQALETDLEDWVGCGPFSDHEDAARYRLKSYATTLAGQAVREIVVHSSSLAEQKAASIEADVESTQETLKEEIDELEAR